MKAYYEYYKQLICSKVKKKITIPTIVINHIQSSWKRFGLFKHNNLILTSTILFEIKNF